MAPRTPLLIGAALASALAAGPAGAENLKGSAAILRGMDKVTARIAKFDAPVGRSVRYGELEILVKACRKRPPEEQPESAAFLEIYEAKKGKARRKVFSGWMFASSPALSAMEHPVYDIWVVDCIVPGTGKKKTLKKASKKR